MTTPAFTFGADPEVFVKKNGKSFSAHGLVEGSKESPQPVEGGAIQVDGMALEFNIDPTPSGDFVQFNQNIVKTLRNLALKAKEADPEVNLSVESVQDFTKEYLDSQPEEAKELGCDPDFNAYTMKENPAPDGERLFRTGAGHLHVGWGSDIPIDNPQHHEICAGFVKMLDATVGLYMTILDSEPRRRELYGKAGAYRAKPYGVEYRTPSNAWIKNKETRKTVHQLMNLAIVFQRQGRTPESLFRATNIEQIINDGDWKSAFHCLGCILSYSNYPGIRKAYNSRVAAEKKG